MAQHYLSNNLSAFIFEDDGTTGLRLASFMRIASQVSWVNNDTSLWRAELWDSSNPTSASTTITPTAATLSPVTVTRTDDASTLVAEWTGIDLSGADTFGVTLTFELRAGEDWLRCTIESAFSGPRTRFAIDRIGWLPIAISPLNRPTDVAIMPSSFGIGSRDPITHLQYSASPGTQFGTMQSNEWHYSSGRGWSMGFWGYYETTDQQAWMAYFEDWSDELIAVRFESDGTNLVWRAMQPQEDHVVIGNNGRTVGSSYTICLRPLECRTANGWWDIAKHYRDRYEVGQPNGYVPVRSKRTDLSDEEKKPRIFVDFSLGKTDHSATNLPLQISRLRAGAGIGSDVNIWGTIEANNYNLANVGETADSSLPTQLSNLYSQQKTSLLLWHADTDSVNGSSGLWNINQWYTAAGAATDRRWYQTHDLLRTIRMSRSGYLLGGGVDRLQQEATRYYRERIYPVTGYAAHVVSVTGAPSGDGFSGTKLAVIIPASSSARLGTAAISSLGASSVTASDDFLDSDGNVVTPANGDTLAVYQTFPGGVVLWCPYAHLHSASFLPVLADNAGGRMEQNWRCTGRYLDTYSDPICSQPDDGLSSRRIPFCYYDHSGWTELDSDYTAHPKGGGSWYVEASRELVRAYRNSYRTSQSEHHRAITSNMACEDIDEARHDVFDLVFHKTATGSNWRSTTGVDPTLHKYLAIPIYAVVHAGRMYGRAINQEFSTALGTSAGSDPDLHSFMAYALGNAWVFGLDLPALSHYEADAVSMANLWNNALYVSGGGSISNTVKQIRDYWVQIQQAELRGLRSRFFEGQMLSPAELDSLRTDTTTGLAQTTYATYHSYDVLYDRATTPRVMHAVWQADDGEVAVVFSNWTDAAAKWAGTLDLDYMNLTNNYSVHRTDAFGVGSTDVSLDRSTGKLTIASVPAFSVAIVYLKKTSEQVSVFRRTWQRWDRSSS